MRIKSATAFLAILLALAVIAPAQQDGAPAEKDTKSGDVAQRPRAEVVTPDKKISLWSQDEMKDWRFALKGDDAKSEDVWSIKDGVVHCKGEPTGFMATKKAYTNYKLHVEWRWIDKAGNSGVLLHCKGPKRSTDKQMFPKCVEAQLQSNNAGDIVIMYGARIKEIEQEYADNSPFLMKRKIKESNEKPVGEWNSYDITCKDDTIKLYVNGLLQNEASGASAKAGYICLQSEGAPVEFRNAYLEPLDK